MTTEERQRRAEADDTASAVGRVQAPRRRAVTRPAGPPPDPFATAEGADDEEQAPQTRLTAGPALTFQPPVVVFQPPVPAPGRRVNGVAAHADDEADDGDDTDDSGLDADTADDDRDGGSEDARDSVVTDDSDDDADDDGEGAGRGSRRRRRRGGRGRGRGKGEDEQLEDQQQAEEPAAETPAEPAEGGRRRRTRRRGAAAEAEAEPADTAAAQDAEADTAGDDDADASGGSSRRRRRRRRSAGTDGDAAAPRPDDPPNTVVRVRELREPRAAGSIEDEVQSVKGSTRLEAKKQRRREGREQGRRRPPVVTESEFLARRESVKRDLVIRRIEDRTQIAVLEDGVLVEHYVDRSTHQSYVGNVYLGRVQNVLPSMEAAFVDIGKGRNAVLYAGEVNWDAPGLEGQPKRIESALKSGQSVLVQVTKDPVGHKGARLTSQVSLPGRYLVYVPDGSMTGISRKLPDKERTRLKQILKRVMPENAGVIVRTAAEGASEEELERDINRLAGQWQTIKRKAKTATAPALLNSEPDLTVRVVRDIFNEDFASLVVSGDGAWQTVEDYVEHVAPHLTERLRNWDEDRDVFTAYRIDEQIAKALDRKVWLPSGGSLVIDRTEAMTVIDVNTGKFTGQGGNLEETVTKNNLEAAEEIVRQLRLRDIGGIIVVDFIDMVLESNRDLVLRRMLECLARDRTKHQVAEVTSLGLVQMTRKRVGQGLLEAFSQPCDCCNGRGLIVSGELVDQPSGGGNGNGGGNGRRKGRKAAQAQAAEAEAEADTTVSAADADTAEVDADEPVDPLQPAEPIEPLDLSEPEPEVVERPKRRRSRRPAGPPPEPEEAAAPADSGPENSAADDGD
ncbi:Rne/Rng family ribonuclease [Allonocardiopsis opalescens]|nr:Rne/Rng family ribonuclease [Allonocardiopsis opalescens]